MANLFIKTVHNATYRAKMPQIDPDFYDYVATEDERAAQRLDTYLTSLLHQRASIAAISKGFSRQPQEGGAPVNRSFRRQSQEGGAATRRSFRRQERDSDVSGACDMTSGAAEDGAGGTALISAAFKKLLNALKTRLGPGRPQVLLPADLTPRLARNIVRMVEGEERGIRGCAIVVSLHDGPNKVTLGKIVCDPACATTTVLHLHLHRADDPDGGVSRTSTSSSSSSDGSSTGNTIYISPGYTLEKRRKTHGKRRADSGNSCSSSTGLTGAGRGNSCTSSTGLTGAGRGSKCKMGSQEYDDY